MMTGLLIFVAYLLSMESRGSTAASAFNEYVSNTTNEYISNSVDEYVTSTCRTYMKSGKLTADCVGKRLSTIPNFTEEIEVILLSRNEITEFPSDDFAFPRNLTELDLSFNKLKELNGCPFQGLANLRRLNLNYNKLEYRNISPNIFSSLTSLVFLGLSSQKTSVGNFSYPSAITTCKSLQVLELDGFNGAYFDPKFRNITSLTNLTLSGHGPQTRCKLRNLKADYFRNTPYLRHLDVSFCNLKSIELGTFGRLNKLRLLNISYNEELSFRVVRNVTTDLIDSDIDTLDVSKIHCTFGVGTYANKHDVINMQNTSLRVLHVDKNRINTFEPGLFSILPKTLQIVSAKDNKFTLGLYILQLKDCQQLKSADISYQSHTHDPLSPENLCQFDCYDDRGPDRGRRMGCESAASGTQDNNCPEGTALRQNQMGYEHIKINLSVINVPPLLETLRLRQSALRYAIPMVHITPNNSVRYLDLSGNVFYEWIGPVVNLNKVEYLDLSNNFCTSVSSKFFKEGANLKVLNISYNLLGYTLQNDVSGEIFHNLTSLTCLDLSLNRIEKLPHNVFKGLRSLEYLNLSLNSIDDWDFQIKHLQYLKFINMSSNQLAFIPADVRVHIDYLRSRNNLTLDFSNNQFQCTCSTLQFLKWMANKEKVFYNFESYHCRFANVSVGNFSDILHAVSELERNCQNFTGLILGCMAVIIVCVISVVGIFVYRYRWKLRYLYFMAKNRYRGYSHVKERPHDECYQYDAFISYSDEDRHFVINEVIENLETNREFRLCLHQRDFLPGAAIAENITNAIHNSRKTIAILSKNYLKSHWCLFEFNMAKMESIYSRDGENVLFVIMYDQVTAHELPLNILEVVESQSYIEYTRDQQGEIVFWDKLADVIGS